MNWKKLLPTSSILILIFGILFYIIGQEYAYGFIKFMGCVIIVIGIFGVIDDIDSGDYDKWRKEK